MTDTTNVQPNPEIPQTQGWRQYALLVTLLLVSAVCQIDRILPFILAESIKKDLHLSDTQLGLITGIAFSICYSLAALPLARIADKGHGKKVLLYCILIWSATTSLGGLATGFLTLAFSRLGVALGEAGGTPASHSLIVRQIPERFRGRAIGLFSMGIPLGTMAGFGLGGWAGDTVGWRNTLFAAGVAGLLLAVLVALFSRSARFPRPVQNRDERFWSASRKLLSKPAFVSLFIAASAVGFAAAPFYIFTTPFLIRTHVLTASEAGLAFGVLQGIMGIVGTLAGGRLFDRAVARGGRRLMHPPSIAFIVAAVATLAGLFAPVAWLSIALFVPAMFSFAFALPYAFGAGHLVAGPGKQAFSTSLMMIGSGLLGPALAPVIVGLISDSVTASYAANGLRWGLVIVPFASVFSAAACLVVSRRVREFLERQGQSPSPSENPS